MSAIDWARVAEPQLDGYDVRVTLRQLQAGRYALKPLKPLPLNAKPVWPEGRAVFVTMGDAMRPAAELQDLRPEHELVQKGLALLEAWPAVRQQCPHLIMGLSPLTMGRPQAGHGCTCGNYGDDWGWIYVTGDNAWGFAEGTVHEMAHWKLRAFGIWFEDWTDQLLLNKPSELYVSPVRKDIERPMGAVLHGQYSYVHVAEMCVRMLAVTEKPGSGDIEWTALQLRRITEGQGTLRGHARGTEAGTAFLAGLDAWTTRVLEQGQALIKSVSA